LEKSSGLADWEKENVEKTSNKSGREEHISKGKRMGGLGTSPIGVPLGEERERVWGKLGAKFAYEGGGSEFTTKSSLLTLVLRRGELRDEHHLEFSKPPPVENFKRGSQRGCTVGAKEKKRGEGKGKIKSQKSLKGSLGWGSSELI